MEYSLHFLFRQRIMKQLRAEFSAYSSGAVDFLGFRLRLVGLFYQ